MMRKEPHPSEAITGSLMISCEIGQMNSGGQSDGTQRTTLSLDEDLEVSPIHWKI